MASDFDPSTSLQSGASFAVGPMAADTTRAASLLAATQTRWDSAAVVQTLTRDDCDDCDDRECVMTVTTVMSGAAVL